MTLGYGELLNNQPTREQIEAQLQDAEKSFNEAKEMFNPWYTGPLLAPSAHCLSPGYVNLQPYLFITDNYGAYTNSGKMEHRSHHLFTLNPLVVGLVGITHWMEATFQVQGIYNSQNGHSSINIGDLPIGLGFGILAEKPYVPALLLSIQESFPVGKYQHLNPNKGGVDATGSGAYVTKISLNTSKLVWWWFPKHPMNFRLALSYGIPTTVHVEGFNTYGGGYGTDGKVHPGQTFGLDFGYEFSFTQKWAFALDIVYNYVGKTTFSGYPGLDSNGNVASVGGPFSEQVSLAPAIEYNLNANFGFIGGVWFTVWGRNSSAFVSGVLSFTYTF
ncbi:MAG: hypothetical protein FJZ63_03085 [Chlamydiae bacterium]|nr:hypothetical protein [Chlamydiota bacterium]